MQNKLLSVFYILKFTLLFTIVITLTSSCATYKVKDIKNIKKVDKKIIEEFNEGIENEEFYKAAESYIEFVNCFNDKRKSLMIEKLENLYRIKMDMLKKENQNIDLIEYTFSLINLIGEDITVYNLNNYKQDLYEYIKKFVDTDLRNKREIEKVSWLIYLTNFTPDNPFIYKILLEIFIDRNNSVLSKKYYDKYKQVLITNKCIQCDEKLKKELTVYEDKIQKLTLNNEMVRGESIEDTIKSSVKIVVDRGIKTEGGVGVPDQVLGTGVVIDKIGYIITNYHIIESSVDPKYEGYSRIYVIPNGDEGIKLVAKVVGYDSICDLALIKVEKEMTSLIRVGDSDKLKQGEKIVAIGNPVGLVNTVTSGIVSSTDRPFLQIGNIIQIDAALNPGNSGGALINKDGYLVGITFAGLEKFENLNFAIPSNLLLSILFKLYETGEIKRSWIGSSVSKGEKDIKVGYVVPNSPSSLSGITRGNIIKGINGSDVTRIFDLQSFISSLNRPLVIKITVETEGRSLFKSILLNERPEQPSLYIYNHDATENIIVPLFGMVITELDNSRKNNYTVQHIITNSVASKVGISEGDVIKLKKIKYDKNSKVFYLYLELKSKRFGYINKSMVLYTYAELNSFI